MTASAAASPFHTARRHLAAASIAVLLLGCASPSATNPPSPSDPPGGATGAPGRGSPTAVRSAPTPGSDVPASPTEPASVTARCAEVVAGLTRTERAGQLLMAGVASTGTTRSTRRTLRSTRVGSVVLLGNSRLGRSRTSDITERLRSGAHRTAGIGLLVAVDQEGGLVQRLRGPGFSRIPSARVQGGWSVAILRKRSGQWGRELRRAGVDVDLAPVADVVPKRLMTVNEPIGRLQRGFGSRPSVVGRRVTAVVDGLQGAEVSATLKHFPGLGEVRGNTDFVTRVVDRTTERDDPSLGSFRAGIRAGADLVMMSSATYTRIDPSRRAAYSRTIVTGLLRRDLGFTGVVISDDLTAPGVQEGSAARRALRFLSAGGDLVIISDGRELRGVVGAVRERMRTDPAFAADIDRKVARILALKAERGRAGC